MTIYDRTFKVPVWVVVNGSDNLYNKVSSKLIEDGALERPWPGLNFKETVKSLASKGWGHVVKREYPFVLPADFLPVAVMEHITRSFGSGKMLGGAPSKPWNQAVDRTVASDTDYERIFNQVLALEDGVSLSQVLDIGNLCHNGVVKNYVFVSRGPVPKNVLQIVSNAVIVVGEGGDVPTAGIKMEKVIESLETVIRNVI